MMEKTKYFEFYPGNTRKTLQQLTLFSKHCIHHLKVSFKEWGNVIWNYTISDQRFPHGAVLPCEGCILATVWRCFWLSPWEGQLLASSGWKSGLLLNLLQSSGPTQRGKGLFAKAPPVWPKTSVVLRLRSPISDFSMELCVYWQHCQHLSAVVQCS